MQHSPGRRPRRECHRYLQDELFLRATRGARSSASGKAASALDGEGVHLQPARAVWTEHLHAELLLYTRACGAAPGAADSQPATGVEGRDDERTRSGALDVPELGNGQVEIVLEREDSRVRPPYPPPSICLFQYGYLGGLAFQVAEVREYLEQLFEPPAFREVIGKLAEGPVVAARPVPPTQWVGISPEVGRDRDMRRMARLATMEVPLLHCLAELVVKEVQLPATPLQVLATAAFDEWHHGHVPFSAAGSDKLAQFDAGHAHPAQIEVRTPRSYLVRAEGPLQALQSPLEETDRVRSRPRKLGDKRTNHPL